MYRPDYRIYPSLLGKFQDLLDAEYLWDQFYGAQEEPEITLEDYIARTEREMLDSVNRVPFVSEAASRGTALNYIVDSMVLGRKPEREGLTVTRLCNPGDPREVVGLRASLDGFTFDFDIALCRELAEYFARAVCQYRCSAPIATCYGTAELYGDLDYLKLDKVHDLKTTGNYTFGKYERGWQKDLYPYCLIESGDMATVSSFEYTVCVLSGGNARNPLITGTLYREEYTYDHGAATGRLRAHCERLIEWLEAHRAEITDKKIFNITEE